MVTAKIAFRNIFRSKTRSLLTGLMMAGGCALFAISLGLVSGSYGAIIDGFTRDHTGHIQVHAKGYLDKPTLYKVLQHPTALGAKIASLPAVRSWTPRIYSPALAFAGTRTAGARIVGVDPVREPRTTRLALHVGEGRFVSANAPKGIVLSHNLARTLKVGLGGEVALIAEGADGSIANGLFRVAGIMREDTGGAGMSQCYLPIETARSFLSLPTGVHELVVVLNDYRKTEATVGKIRTLLHDPSIDVEPWQVIESEFYTAMQADIKGNWWTMTVLTVIIAVGVLNTVLMAILERTREFGILKALGSRPSQIFLLIVLETAFLAVLSIVAGTLCGLAGNWWLSLHGISYPSPIEYGGFAFTTMTSQITTQSILLPAGVVFGAAVLVSLWPALRAARIVPVKALRSN